MRQQKEKIVKNRILFSNSASDIYEIFWGKFAEELYNWLRRLQRNAFLRGLRTVYHKWVHSDLAALHRLDIDSTRDVDLWVQYTLEGYIVEFAAKCYQYFSKVKDAFRSGLRGGLLRDIPLWIQALMVDKGLMEFQKPEMET